MPDPSGIVAIVQRVGNIRDQAGAFAADFIVSRLMVWRTEIQID